jgi:predicted ATPase
MEIEKKTKRYNFKEEKLELCLTYIERFPEEQVVANHTLSIHEYNEAFIRVLARRLNIPPNRLMPERPSRR